MVFVLYNCHKKDILERIQLGTAFGLPLLLPTSVVYVSIYRWNYSQPNILDFGLQLLIYLRESWLRSTTSVLTLQHE
ncbi:hypothetical protein M5689_021098 [Euphorbia peplus]|nr:hypothetical protein M5689_021098 [Euphorbia peplus]